MQHDFVGSLNKSICWKDESPWNLIKKLTVDKKKMAFLPDLIRCLPTSPCPVKT